MDRVHEGFLHSVHELYRAGRSSVWERRAFSPSGVLLSSSEALVSLQFWLLCFSVSVCLPWTIVILAELAGDIVFARYTMDSPDNLSARRIRTQTHRLFFLFSSPG